MSSLHQSYARALLDLAVEKKVLKTTEEVCQGLLEGFSDASLFLSHPRVKKEDFKKIIESVTDEPLLLQFIDALIHHHRMGDLIPILEAFFKTLKALENEKTIHVYSAKPLSEPQHAQLVELFKKRFKHPTLTVHVEPNMVGGLKINYDDKVFDASTQSTYDTLKHTISR